MNLRSGYICLKFINNYKNRLKSGIILSFEDFNGVLVICGTGIWPEVQAKRIWCKSDCITLVH